jgi:hypothetical protein
VRARELRAHIVQLCGRDAWPNGGAHVRDRARHELADALHVREVGL